MKDAEQLQKLLTVTASGLGDNFPVLQRVLMNETIQQTLIDLELYDGWITTTTQKPPLGLPVIVTDGRETASCVRKYNNGTPEDYQQWTPKRVNVKAWTYFPVPPVLN